MKKHLLLLVFFPSLIFGFGSPPETHPHMSLRHGIDAAYLIAQQATSNRLILFSDVAFSYLKINDIDTILLVMQEPELSVNSITKSTLLRDMVIYYAETFGKEAAESLIPRLQDNKQFDYLLENLIVFYLHNDQLDEARALTPKIQNSFVRSRLQKQLVGYYCDDGRFEDAEGVLDSIQNLIEKDGARSLICEYALQDNRESFALSHLEKIRTRTILDDTYALIALIFGKTSKFDQSFTYVNKIESMTIYHETLSNIVGLLALDRKFDSALQIAQTIQDPYYLSLALANMAEVLADQELSEDSLLMLEEISLSNIRDDSRSKIALSEARRLRHDNALDMAFQITDPALSHSVAVEVAKIFGQSRDYHYPLLLLKKEPDSPLKWDMMVSFLEQLAFYIDSTRIAKIINNIFDIETQERCYEAVIGSYIQNQDFESAFDLANTLPFRLEIFEAGASDNRLAVLKSDVALLPDSPEKFEYMIRLLPFSSTETRRNTFVQLEKMKKFRDDALLADAYIRYADLFSALQFIEQLDSIDEAVYLLLTFPTSYDEKTSKRISKDLKKVVDKYSQT